HGEGYLCFCYSRTDVVTCRGRGLVRRLGGATLLDETTGAVITYDNTTDVFMVDGGAQNRSAANPSGRIRAMLSPRSPVSAPAAGPAPAAPAAGSAPVLRPSPALAQ
ncbi:MAG: lipopolysaccharide transport periplasmic protein LptA, partial [Polaromonas sp.]|nr:lipopolysaccharide transport periplasmic protein LptA [Polaromonas sp.]